MGEYRRLSAIEGVTIDSPDEVISRFHEISKDVEGGSFANATLVGLEDLRAHGFLKRLTGDVDFGNSHALRLATDRERGR